jgi:hypothetical protein
MPIDIDSLSADDLQALAAQMQRAAIDRAAQEAARKKLEEEEKQRKLEQARRAAALQKARDDLDRETALRAMREREQEKARGKRAVSGPSGEELSEPQGRKAKRKGAEPETYVIH